MREKTLKIETVHQCNCCLGGKTLHPLVSVIDLSKAPLTPYADIRFGFYTILLSERKCEIFAYGRHHHDYSDGTLICLPPGQSIHMNESDRRLPSEGWIVAFHPDLICGTTLGQNLQDYTCFSYRPEEALHVSLREKQTLIECLNNIDQELKHCLDHHSRKIISRYIELLLDYCTRFYERQFITRNDANNEIIKQFNRILEDYFETNQPQTSGLPSDGYCAAKLRLSPAYLSDLLKIETGKSIQESIQVKRIHIAQLRLMNTNKSIRQIALELGFQNPQHFSYLFRKATGCSPTDSRIHN